MHRLISRLRNCDSLANPPGMLYVGLEKSLRLGRVKARE